jgi:hypothetical protein
MSADVPMIGTTLNEFTTGINHPEYEAMTIEALRARLAAVFPDRAESTLTAFRKTHAGSQPFRSLVPHCERPFADRRGGASRIQGGPASRAGLSLLVHLVDRKCSMVAHAHSTAPRFRSYDAKKWCNRL